jgi:hypothetical protein
MTGSTRRRDEGQVLIIFVGSLFLFIVIAAVVIDLGFAFMIRRQEQNAADPGAIAAARYIRPTPTTGADVPGMRAAACLYARQNGFFPAATSNTECIPSNDPDGTTLTVNYPPSTSAGPRFAGTPGFVEVIISRPHRLFFGGLLAFPQITITSNAVAAFSNGDSNSSSLISLDPTHCASGHIHGTGTINIHRLPGVTSGGFVQVNSNCSNGSADNVCSPSGGGLKVDSNASNFTAPMTYVVGSCQATSGTINGGLTEGAAYVGDPLAELPAPKLSDYPAGRCSPTDPPLVPGDNGCRFSGTSVTLQPGIYYGGWDIRNNVVLTLSPGMYIFAGGGVTLNAGGSITSVQGSGGTPAPVMFFNTDDPSTHSGQANIDFTATSTLSLRPIASGPYQNILMWNDGNGSNPTASISLGGQTVLDIAGTIYSPKGNVILEGGSGVGGSPTNRAAIQIIAWQWDIGGNGTLDMPYDPAGLYQLDQKGLVH